MNSFDENEHPRATGGRFVTKSRDEADVVLADPLPDLDAALAPAGTYYVGDPCYTFSHDDWDALLEQTGLAGEDGAGAARMPDGSPRRVWMVGTRDGDGCYDDAEGNEYGVDSGTLGLVPWDEVPESERETALRGGRVVTFDEPVAISEENGHISFGPVTINTGDPDPVDCWNCGRPCDANEYCGWCGSPCDDCNSYDCEGECVNCEDCGHADCVCDEDTED